MPPTSLLNLANTAAACSPFPPAEAMAQAVLLASPFLLALGLPLFAWLERIARGPHARNHRPRRAWIAFAVFVAAAALGAWNAPEYVPPFVLLAFWIFGATWLALSLLLLRVLSTLMPGRAGYWPPVTALALLCAPAVAALLEAPVGDELMVLLWVVPGLLGATPIAVAILLFIEMLVRGRSRVKWSVPPT
jgi:hypothetical protein